MGSYASWILAKVFFFSVMEYGERSVASLANLKEFMYRIGLAMRVGKEPEEVIRHSSVKTYWKRFTAGYRRHRGEIDRQVRLELLE